MTEQSDPTSPQKPSPRRDWMSLLAKADAAALARHWAELTLEPVHEFIRAPEIGSVMVRGRAGATGAAFNLGEMTVARCSVRLDSGEEGHAWVQGRDREKARQAALVDALMQTDLAGRVKRDLLDPLREARKNAKTTRAARAAATKVDFFTMARGED